MRKKIFINILLFTIMVFSTVALIGFIIWNKPHLDVKDANAIETNAIALYQALSQDSLTMKTFLLTAQWKKQMMWLRLVIQQK